MRAPPVLVAAALLAAAGGAAALELAPQQVTLGGREWTVAVARGLTLEVLSEQLQAPRLLAFAPDGTLFVGSRRGRIFRLEPPYRRARGFAELSGYPHSVAFRRDEILIARSDGVYTAPWAPAQRRLDLRALTLLARLPGGGEHSSRSVAVGPDGRVFVALGISANCSDEHLSAAYPLERRRGGVLVLDETQQPARWQPYASGLRNPVGFAWHPTTGVMYASNNGPDHLGFEQPPEYFSRLDPGSFHGMPWYQFDGRRIVRDDCMAASPPQPRATVMPPVATFPARIAPMGVAFVPSGALLPALEGDALVALHGSWATAPDGRYDGDPSTRRAPALVRVRFRAGEVSGVVETLLQGLQLADGTRVLRPVGVAIGPDGALYFSSDGGHHALLRLRRALP